MRITFSNKLVTNPNTFGIDFEAIVDGHTVVCTISAEALQDIDPNNTQTTIEQKFRSNQFAIEAIAERKIFTGYKSPIIITTADLKFNHA